MPTDIAADDPTVVPPAAPADGKGLETAPFSPAYTRYALWLLLGIYTINFLDRQVINILAEPIKKDLGLADWQLGLMSGLAFALFYTFLGLPIARLAEKRNRALIIGTSVAVWSGFTALCGSAQTFSQLLLYRIGVGVGEAGCTPPAHSLISDMVPREKRSSALAFYHMGTPIGSLLGLVFGGLVADAYGWRMAFLVAGVPGLIFAALAVFTLREPRKLIAAQAARAQALSATFGETLKHLMKTPTFGLVAAAAAVQAFVGYGHSPFTVSFFLRVHSAEVADLAKVVGGWFGWDLGPIGFMGLSLGIFSGVAGAGGAFFGGWLADRAARRDIGSIMTGPAIASLVSVPVYIAAVSLPSALGALIMLAISVFLGTIWYGPIYASAQSVAPAHMRATASAILVFIINLIGLGLGPLGVGILSDALNHAGLGSAEGVRWALILSTLIGVATFFCLWRVRKTLARDSIS
ncbi:MAG: MFS transporter [Caulobacteraceae bacterium]|nr:MAG: MFS transporter [Caulobacteraceae bacterium]